MTAEEINHLLTELFDGNVQTLASGSWQVETTTYRLLVLLSDDQSWLRILMPLVPAETAQPFTEQLLADNFDATQETRYALHQGVLWGVFHHRCASLDSEDFLRAVQRLIALHEQGLSNCFNQLVETRIYQIIRTAKQQGQSLEGTLQTLNRFYQEGLMGEIDQNAESREQVLATWQRQLERLWPEVEP